jgi:hypothetical protein
MKKTYGWRLIATCAFPLALTSWGQNYPNGNPGDWSDSNTGNPISVTTSPTGGPNGGYTTLNNLYPSQDNGPYSWFGSPPPNPSSPGPASSGLTQSIAVYLNPSLSSQQSGGVVIDMVPNATTLTPQYGTPQLWGAEEEFALAGTSHGLNINLWPSGPSIASGITSAGWYDFSMSFVPGAAGTPVTIDLNVNDLSTGDSLVGSISTTAVDAGTGTYLSENLDGSGYVWLTEWSDGFAGNSLEVADVQAAPDGATTILLLGSSFAGLAILRRRFGRS